MGTVAVQHKSARFIDLVKNCRLSIKCDGFRRKLQLSPPGEPPMTISARGWRHGLLQFFLLAGLTMLAWNTGAKDQAPVFSSHVSDTAEVMGWEAAVVASKLRAFEAATGHQLFVLTVQTTGSRSIDEYAVDVFQKWKVGQKNVDDGVLFVIAVADRKMRIEVGYGLEGILTDAICSRIVHDIVAPQLAKGEYGAGIQSGVDALLLALGAPAPVASDAAPDTSDAAGKHTIKPGVKVFFILLFLTFVVGSVWFGGIGLIMMFIPVLAVPGMLGPEWPSGLISTAILAAWLWARWALIVRNVRKYHSSPQEPPLFSAGSGCCSLNRGRPARCAKGKNPYST
jgi:uncharacterized protein